LSGFDLLIKYWILIDGTGRQRFRADIGVTMAKSRTSVNYAKASERVTDAKGCFLSPCFIDDHAHSDRTRPCLKA